MIRFYNGRIFTLERDTALTAGELWADGDKITLVGQPTEPRPAFEREIDMKGGLLLPGFKNAHAHSAMVFGRSYADDLPLQDWLFGKILPLEAKLNPEAIYALTRLAILEYLSGGITAAFDMYYCRDAIAQAGIDSGFRTVICGGLSAGDDWQDAVRCYEKYNSLHPLVGYRLGAHSEYTADLPLLRQLSELCHSYKAPFFAHNSETKSEVEQCRERHGLSPTALFEREGLFDYGGGGFHCVWFDQADIDIFRRRGLTAVSCPGSNAKLASGIAPLTELQNAGVRLALGTDGASSNNALDMFREMYLACVLQKLKDGDAAAMDALTVLQAACRGGAEAMGLEDCRCLAPGMQADLTLLDLNAPNLQPGHDPARNVVYSGNPSNVTLTMIAGRVLYENGEYHVGEQPEEIIRQARTAVEKLLKA